MTKHQAVNVMTPNFVNEFACIGADCADNCCHSWNVNVDKKTFKNLKKNNNVIIKQLVDENLTLTRQSNEAWGNIKLTAHGDCPFLDNQGWCEIHKQCGHQALAKTCQNYPRNMLMFGQQIEASLSISCPSAAQSVLLNPSAFMFNNQETATKALEQYPLGGFNEQTLPPWLPILRDFAFSIVMFEKIPLEQRLFVLGMVCKQGEKFLSQPQRLQEFILTAEEMVVDGSFSKMFTALPQNNTLKWLMFANQNHKLEQESDMAKELTSSAKGQENESRFGQCRAAIFELLAEAKTNKKQPSDQETFLDILQQGQSLLDDYFAQAPHVLVNYLLYYLYHNQFMVNHQKTPFQFYKIMSVDFFMLRTYLAGIAVKEKGLTDQWLIQLFQSYARRRQHDAHFVKNMEIQLENSNMTGAEAVFCLLK